MCGAIQSLKMAAIHNLRNIEDLRRASESQPDSVASGLNPLGENLMKKLSIVFGMMMIFAVAAIGTSAQSKVDVRFQKGKTIGYYNGSIRGEKYIDYVMRAKGGQTLRVVLTKRSGSPTYFNVLRPGSDVAIADDARESQSWKGELPVDGNYVVRVYLAKADRLANRAGAFKVGFSIEVE